MKTTRFYLSAPSARTQDALRCEDALKELGHEVIRTRIFTGPAGEVVDSEDLTRADAVIAFTREGDMSPDPVFFLGRTQSMMRAVAGPVADEDDLRFHGCYRGLPPGRRLFATSQDLLDAVRAGVFNEATEDEVDVRRPGLGPA